ncbi:putative reverse transcriptase domain-containing protein [Tanacetum coccineum]
MNAVGTLQDPKVVTGTFSLNDHFATVLFDFGVDFSLISTKFVSLLNMKPSIMKPSYVIEVADGKNVEVNRIIHGCKLELGNSLFTIDLIPLGYGRFDVIVGMDWLSEHKAVIICPEKVVRIPLATGFPTLKISTTLKSMKLKVYKVEDIPIVRDFPEDKGFIRPSHSPWGAPVLFVKKKDRLTRSEELAGELTVLEYKRTRSQANSELGELTARRTHSQANSQPGVLTARRTRTSVGGELATMTESTRYLSS